MTHQDFETVRAADDTPLTARFFEPATPPRAAVLITAAMGVKQDFYAPLASWLAERGFLVATFDYRGIGRSRFGPLRDLETNVVDWAQLDCAAMVDELDRRAAGLPLLWVGHSLGGQIVPFVPNRDRISKVITVATGSGYWRENTPSLRLKVWWLWFFVVPIAHALYGYFPGRRLGKVGDLPRGVMAQWRRWCLDPEYAVGVEPDAREQFAAVETPIVSISFTDDEMMSARNTESIHSFYSGAPKQMRRLDPRAVGLSRIGHFGFFRAENAETLWRPWLLAELEG